METLTFKKNTKHTPKRDRKMIVVSPEHFNNIKAISNSCGMSMYEIAGKLIDFALSHTNIEEETA